MGYDASFKVKGEIDQRFKSWSKTMSEKDVKKYKTLLIGVCMLDREVSSTDLKKVYDEIEMYTQMYINSISETWKINLEKILKEEDNEFHVCGWAFSSSGSFDWTIDSLLEYTVEQLYLLAIAKCGSVFSLEEEEREEYYAKLQEVKDDIGDIEETVWDIWNHDFFETYKDAEGSEFDESY